MKMNHFTHCLVGVAAAVGLLLVFGVKAGTLVALVAVLACPLMMVFMMRGMTGGHGQGQGHGGCDHPDHQHTGRDTRQPTEQSR